MGHKLNMRAPFLPYATVKATPKTQPYYYDNKHVASLMNADMESLPEPLQVMREYISQHGVDKQGEFARPGEKYIRMRYHCPVRN